MPKNKTHSGTAKRVKITGTGKVKAGVAFKRHCLGAKSQKMKRTSRGAMVLSKPDGIIVKRFLPYGRP